MLIYIFISYVVLLLSTGVDIYYGEVKIKFLIFAPIIFPFYVLGALMQFLSWLFKD